MLNAKTLSDLKSSSQFKNLEKTGLKLVSTDRQLENGTLSFKGGVKVGDMILESDYQITAVGMVISNKRSARFVEAKSNIATYRKGLTAVADLLYKRMQAA